VPHAVPEQLTNKTAASPHECPRHRDLNARIVAATGISPGDLLVNLLETLGENLSLGKGLAQRADAVIAP
jgi:hypothetical protein